MGHEAVLASTAAHPAGCARLSAFHRGSHQGAFAPFAQLQARLPGTWQERIVHKPAPTGERRRCASKRALPAPACPSPGNAPPAPAVVPASVMPEAARVRGANPRAGTALAPSSGLPPKAVPYVSDIVGIGTEMETNVKRPYLSDHEHSSSVGADLVGVIKPNAARVSTTVERAQRGKLIASFLHVRRRTAIARHDCRSITFPSRV